MSTYNNMFPSKVAFLTYRIKHLRIKQRSSLVFKRTSNFLENIKMEVAAIREATMGLFSYIVNYLSLSQSTQTKQN